MITIAEMIDDLRKCYKCCRKEPCFGCPYNGSKLEIIELLKRIGNNKIWECDAQLTNLNGALMHKRKDEG